MKNKVLLLLLFCFASHSVMADWIKFHEDKKENTVLYMDPHSASWGALNGKIRILEDLKGKPVGPGSWSFTWLREYDCEDYTEHDSKYVFYSGHMGEGKELITMESMGKDWHRVPAGEKEVMSVACGGLIKLTCQYKKKETDSEDDADSENEPADAHIAKIPASSGGEGVYSDAGWVKWTVSRTQFVGSRRDRGAPAFAGQPAIPPMIYNITISRIDGAMVYEFYLEGRESSRIRNEGTCQPASE